MTLTGLGYELNDVPKVCQAFDQVVFLAFLEPLVRVAAQAHCTRVLLSQGEPLRMRVDRRLPALSSLRAQMHAQEIR